MVEKMPKKGQKNKKKFYFKKNLSVAHVSTFIFQGLLKNCVFRSVTLLTKKLWAIF